MKRIEFDGEVHEFPEDFTDDDISAALSDIPAKTPTAGMGDVKMAESQAEPAPEPSFLDKASVLQPSLRPIAQAAGGAVQFAGNVAKALSTGPINAVAQGIQDKAGVMRTAKNVVRAVADPFIPGESPIQSTETTLERAGVPNQPRTVTERLPGFLVKEWARTGSNGFKPGDADGIEDSDFIERQREQPGRAKELGFVTDAATPLYGVAAVKAMGSAARAALGSRAAKAVQEAAGTGLEGIGKSQMNKVIKPLMRHERKARKPIEQVVFDYGLDKGKGGASPKAVYERSTAKLNELGAKLKAEIKAGRDAGARINTDELIDKAVADLKANPGESEDFYTMVNDIDEIAADFKARAQAANGTGSLDLLQGHNFKKYMGHEGAWQGIAQSKGIPLTAKETSRSKIAEEIYHRLNDAIDEAAPNGIKDLNRQISEIIPANQAAGWRQIVEGRGNAVSLSDVVGMTATAINPKVWPIVALNRATKSGTVASKIYRLGEAMKAGKPSAKAVSLWSALQKPLKETQKVRLMQLLEAELEAAAPANAIPFQPKKVAEEDQDTGTLSMKGPR